MARFISRTLLRQQLTTAHRSPTKSAPPLIPLYLQRRNRSTKPQLIEIDLSSSSSASSSSSSSSSSSLDSEGESEQLLLQKLEEIVHRLMLQKSTPDWIPFIPGSSFWVPPSKRPLSINEVINKLTNVLTDEESLALTTCRGWPCSSYFVPTTTTTTTTNDGAPGKVHLDEVVSQEQEDNGKVEVPLLVDSEDGASGKIHVEVVVPREQEENGTFEVTLLEDEEG